MVDNKEFTLLVQAAVQNGWSFEFAKDGFYMWCIKQTDNPEKPKVKRMLGEGHFHTWLDEQFSQYIEENGGTSE